MRGPDRAILTVRFESDPEEKALWHGAMPAGAFSIKGSSSGTCPPQFPGKAFLLYFPIRTTASSGTAQLWALLPSVPTALNGKAESAPQVDYWVTAGENPRQIMHQYAVATGMPSMMPDFAMGFGSARCATARRKSC